MEPNRANVDWKSICIDLNWGSATLFAASATKYTTRACKEKERVTFIFCIYAFKLLTSEKIKTRIVYLLEHVYFFFSGDSESAGFCHQTVIFTCSPGAKQSEIVAQRHSVSFRLNSTKNVCGEHEASRHTFRGPIISGGMLSTFP